MNAPIARPSLRNIGRIGMASGMLFGRPYMAEQSQRKVADALAEQSQREVADALAEQSQREATRAGETKPNAACLPFAGTSRPRRFGKNGRTKHPFFDERNQCLASGGKISGFDRTADRVSLSPRNGSPPAAPTENGPGILQIPCYFPWHREEFKTCGGSGGHQGARPSQ
jgi:hypothetical protein